MEEQEARSPLGRRIKAIRLRRELPQETLGEQVWLNYKYLGAIERGECNPSLKQLLKIAQALGVEPHELLMIEQKEPSVPKLRTMMQELLRESGRTELQFAYKLLKALLR
jgi:transcriptional regulator with XRE-family HTH domain